MSFSKYWQRLSTANEPLKREDTKMTITVSAFKASLSKVKHKNKIILVKNTLENLDLIA